MHDVHVLYFFSFTSKLYARSSLNLYIVQSFDLANLCLVNSQNKYILLEISLKIYLAEKGHLAMVMKDTSISLRWQMVDLMQNITQIHVRNVYQKPLAGCILIYSTLCQYCKESIPYNGTSIQCYIQHFAVHRGDYFLICVQNYLSKIITCRSLTNSGCQDT